jgi:hypothetical protein
MYVARLWMGGSFENFSDAYFPPVRSSLSLSLYCSECEEELAAGTVEAKDAGPDLLLVCIGIGDDTVSEDFVCGF